MDSRKESYNKRVRKSYDIRPIPMAQLNNEEEHAEENVVSDPYKGLSKCMLSLSIYIIRNLQ